MAMFLTREEIAELTGRKTRDGQIRALKHNHLPFFLNAAGWPIVTTAAITGGDNVNPAANQPKMWRSNILG